MTRRRGARLLLLLAPVPLVLAACVGWNPFFGPERPKFRLVSWNIHHARGLDGRVDVDRIADELAALAPDAVCLQEVDVGVERSGRIDIPALLAARLDMHAAFGKNIDYQGGDYGNAILTRQPITWQHNLHYRMLRDGEQRGLLMIGLESGLGVACTHLDWRPDDRERQENAVEILAAVYRSGISAVAGDFNDRPGSGVHDRLTAGLIDCWNEVAELDGPTFPSSRPDRRIDWVLVRRRGNLLPVAARVHGTDASDHCAVVVDFEIVKPDDDEFFPPPDR